jgi:hypothetical protein
MKRTTQAFLIAAMAASLWPLGLVVMLSGGGDQPSVPRPAPAIRGAGKPSSARPELEEIASQAHELNEELGDGELHAGEPRYDLTARAREIEDELVRWRRHSRAATRSEEQAARRLVQLTQAISELTEYPSQKALRAYNRALRRFNAAIRGR